jgi:hypothetical protein
MATHFMQIISTCENDCRDEMKPSAGLPETIDNVSLLFQERCAGASVEKIRISSLIFQVAFATLVDDWDQWANFL